MTSLKTLLEATLPRIQGSIAVYVSDKDGVVVESAGTTSGSESYGTIFAICAEQAGKMSLGRTKTITAMYSDRCVVHLNACPLVVTFITRPDANIGAILSLAPEIVHALEPLHSTIEAVSQP